MSKQDKAALRYLNTQGITNYNEKMRIIGTLKHDVPNLRLDKGKFVTAGLRMYYNDELSNYQSITALNRILKDISIGNHSEEYDFSLNGLTLEELSLKYAEAEKIDTEKDRIRSINRKFIGDSYYTIVPIETFEEANKYCEYTSWCITHSEETFKSLNCGGNRFYFCYKDGFEQVQENNESAPLNEYGLSLISVLIDMDGNLDTITSRYNHEYNGENNEGLRNTEQLEDVLNVGFYNTFIPYTREELHAKGVVMFDEVQGLLDSGKNPKDLLYFCYDELEYHNTEFKLVRLNSKYNWLTKDNKILFPNKWFNYAGEFSCGYANIIVNNKHNFIDTNGNYLTEQWFDYVTWFINGFACIFISNKGYNWINTNGEILFPDKWFDKANNFVNDVAWVQKDKLYNIINRQGKFLFRNWCNSIDFYPINNYALISRINKKGKILRKFYKLNERKFTTKKWINYVEDFGITNLNFFIPFYKVKLNGKWNLVDSYGNFVNPNYWSDFEPKRYGFTKQHIIIGIENNNYKDIYCDEKGDLIIEEEKFLETILKKHNENKKIL